MTTAKKRRWYRFSLRTLFIVMTACAFFLGWKVYASREAERLRTRHRDLWSAIQNKQYQEAYSFMTPRYRTEHSMDEFLQIYGGDSVMTINRDITVSVTPWGTGQVDDGQWEGILWFGTMYYWERINGEWYYSGEALTSRD